MKQVWATDTLAIAAREPRPPAVTGRSAETSQEQQERKDEGPTGPVIQRVPREESDVLLGGLSDAGALEAPVGPDPRPARGLGGVAGNQGPEGGEAFQGANRSCPTRGYGQPGSES